MKIADKILNDEEIESMEILFDLMTDLARELEDIAIDALASFKCTQNPWEYPKSHWSNRLLTLTNPPKA